MSGQVSTSGPVDLTLGALALTTGDAERSSNWFTSAETMARRLGNDVWQAQAMTGRARATHW
jgi:hypothetical protein